MPATTDRAALEQLEREANPDGYDPVGGAPDAIYFTEELVMECLEFSAGLGNSVGQRRRRKSYQAAAFSCFLIDFTTVLPSVNVLSS